MDVETAIRTRRTHKAFAPEPLSRVQLDELFELGQWAPNHHLTVPWRFRVVGARSLERLKAAAGPEAAPKLNRCPTLVVVSAVLDPDDELAAEEDLHSTAVAAYIVLLAAHARGLAGYWRTPGVLRTDAGREAVALAPNERFVGLLHIGRPRQEQRPPERPPLAETVAYLD